MKIKIIFSIVLVTIIFGSLNFYIGIKGLKFIHSINFKFNLIFYWIGFSLISMSYIIARLSEKFIPSKLYEILTLIGSYWLAVMMYGIFILLMIDIIALVNKIFHIINFSPEGLKLTTAVLGFVVIIFTVVILIYGTINANTTVVKNYEVTINKSTKNIKTLNITMVSDIHLGTIIHNGRLLKMVQDINALNPDIILLAGDVIDENVDSFINENQTETFKKLKANIGVYAIRGNHEYFSKNATDLEDYLNKADIKTLVDEGIKIKDDFYLYGRDDISSVQMNGHKRMELSELLKSADKNLPIIIMDHQPYKLNESESNGVDLQFSGHTHKGQLFPSQLITQKIFELDWGYLKKNNLNVIVSSGFGTWGPPIRLGSTSEIVNVKVNFTN